MLLVRFPVNKYRSADGTSDLITSKGKYTLSSHDQGSLDFLFIVKNDTS